MHEKLMASGCPSRALADRIASSGATIEQVLALLAKWGPLAWQLIQDVLAIVNPPTPATPANP